MENARKMIIVPKAMAERLQNTAQSAPLQQLLPPQPPPPLAEGSVQMPRDNLSRLDAEMYEILTSKKFTTEKENCKNYLQALRRFLFFKKSEQLVEEPRDENLAAPLSEETIIERVPKIHQKKARLLLKYWQANGLIVSNGTIRETL